MAGIRENAAVMAEIERDLRQYRVFRSLHRMREASGDASAGECLLLQLRMREIERSVRGLPMCRERVLLDMHYLAGESMERCAELLGVSRATAYRLKRRGLALLAAQQKGFSAHA